MGRKKDGGKGTDLGEKIVEYMKGEFVWWVEGDELEVVDRVRKKR